MSNEKTLNESTISRFKVLAGIKAQAKQNLLQEQGAALDTGPIPEDNPGTVGPVSGLGKAQPGLGTTPTSHKVKGGQGYWHVAKALGMPTNSRTYRQLRDLVRNDIGGGSTVLKTSYVFSKNPDGSVSVGRGTPPRSPIQFTEPNFAPVSASDIMQPVTNIGDYEGGGLDMIPQGDQVVRTTPRGTTEEVSPEELETLRRQETRRAIKSGDMPTIYPQIAGGPPASPIGSEAFEPLPPTGQTANDLYQQLQQLPPAVSDPVSPQPTVDPQLASREREMVLQYPQAYPAAFNKLVAERDPEALRTLEDPITDDMLKQIGIEENQEKIVDKIADILIEYLSEK